MGWQPHETLGVPRGPRVWDLPREPSAGLVTSLTWNDCVLTLWSPSLAGDTSLYSFSKAAEPEGTRHCATHGLSRTAADLPSWGS